jgi:hypothetical protein
MEMRSFSLGLAKKITTVLLAAAVSLAAAPQPAAAAGSYSGITGTDNVLSAINFRDVSGHWAKESIYRVAAQGLMQGSQGYFKPNAAVTKEQAVTMLLGLKGLDAEAQQAAAQAAAAGTKWRDLSEYWGNGYIAVAVREGIIAPEEQQALEQARRSPATREEVATWCGRCLDLDPAYGAQQARMQSMQDWRSIKPGYMGMVAAVINEGIMAGSTGGKFQPKKQVTRAEMAVIADKVSPRMAEVRNLQFREGYVAKRDEVWAATNGGIVKEISYTVKDNSGESLVLTASEVPANSASPKKGFVVYKGNKLGLHDLLKSGDSVKLILTNDNKVLFVQVVGSTAGSLKGIFAGLGPDSRTINIRDVSGKNLVYPLKSAVSVSINNQAASVKDLIHGQEVSLTLAGGSVTGIRGSTTSSAIESYPMAYTQVLEGQVSDVGARKLTLSTNSGRVTLDIDQYTRITRSGSLIPASRVQVGDKVLAYIENGGISGSYVSRVEVAGANNAAGNVYKGYVQAVYPVDGRVVIRDAREYFFGGWYPYSNTLTLNISPGAPVYLDGEAVDLHWLAQAGLGLQLYTLVTDNGAGVRGLKLSAQSGPAEMYSSIVDEVDRAAGAIYLEDVSGTVGPGTIALHNGRSLDAGDIPEGVSVFMETNLREGKHYGTFIAWEDFVPGDYEIARGVLEEVDGREFELDDYSEFEGNSWEDEGSSEDLDLSPEAYIIDARDKNNPIVISPADFRYSQYSGEYEDYSVIAVSRDGLAEGIIILDGDFEGDKTSVARIAAVNGSRITLDREMDWSEATGQWKQNSFPAVLDTRYALIYKDNERVGRGMFHAGDKIYLIHEGRGAYIIFIQ